MVTNGVIYYDDRGLRFKFDQKKRRGNNPYQIIYRLI